MNVKGDSLAREPVKGKRKKQGAGGMGNKYH
jgi:hypothetical protein